MTYLKAAKLQSGWLQQQFFIPIRVNNNFYFARIKNYLLGAFVVCYLSHSFCMAHH